VKPTEPRRRSKPQFADANNRVESKTRIKPAPYDTANCHRGQRASRRWSWRATTARAGNRRFRQLRARRAHIHVQITRNIYTNIITVTICMYLIIHAVTSVCHRSRPSGCIILLRQLSGHVPAAPRPKVPVTPHQALPSPASQPAMSYTS
jgi:hypothetical protein